MHLEVKLLNGGYHAARSNRRSTQEWPPSPARLFSALVSGYYDLVRAEGDQPEVRKALEWLEGHLPEVRFPNPVEKVGEAALSVYVPLAANTGFKPDVHGNTRRCFLWPNRQERTFPVVYPHEPYVYYSWPGLEGPWDSLKRAVDELYYFGTSRSQATFRLLDELPVNATDYNHYVPADRTAQSDLRLFVYYPNRLAELDGCFERQERASNSALPYSKVCPKKASPHQGIFSECRIYSIVGRKIFDTTNAAVVADAFRKEMLRLCGLLGVEPPSVVAHDHDHPHLAYLPLPFVGRYYTDARYVADNLVHGIGIGIPHGIGREEMDQVNQVLSKLEAFRCGSKEFGVIPDESQRKTLQLKTWAGPATTWATVTPVEGKWRSNNNEDLREHCRELKLPELVHVQTHSYGVFGPDFAESFLSRNKLLGRQSGFLTHAVLEFATPVQGPLSLGRTRNFGMGLLRPVPDWTW